MKLKQNIIYLLVNIFVVSSVFGADQFDLVINNGRIMDPESKLDAVRNLGIKDGKITAITKDKLSGKEYIDANGLVVAPGFVDLHSHGSPIPFSQKMHLRDGVTTPLENEVGANPVDLFYNNLKGQSRTNYGATASPMGVRETVFNSHYKTKTGHIVRDLMDVTLDTCADMSMSSTVPNQEQIKEISAQIEEGLRQGGLGIGVPVGYMTTGTTSQETADWQRLAAKYGVATYLHGRFSSQMPPTSGILGMEEMLSSVSVYGGGLLIQHIHQQTLSQTPMALKMIDDARKKGAKVQAEVYPYNIGSTIVGADYLVPSNYGPNMGHTYKDILEVATMKPLTKERYEELVKTNPGANVLFTGISNEGMLSALAHPTTFVGSDSMPMTITKTGKMAIDWDIDYKDVSGHPRAAGTHAKILRLVRETKIMPLMLAISKMSYMPAKFLEDNGVPSMALKGRIKVGADADITIFDPKTVKDNSTYKQGGLPSTGIPFVIVNGTIIVKDSKVINGIFPGKPVRNAVLK